MSSIFSVLRQYAGKWNVSNSRSFTDEERNLVASTRIVASQYGNSVCFMMKSGAQTFIPLSNTSSLGVGESIDMATAKLLTLSKEGEADIFRVEA